MKIPSPKGKPELARLSFQLPCSFRRYLCLLILVVMITPGYSFRSPNVTVIEDFVRNLYQGTEVSGHVSDENGESLIGVTVKIKGTSQGTVSDVNGKYRLVVNSESDVLTFSYIGFVTQERVVGNGSTIDVVMQPDVHNLEEVVVIGYGTVKKKDLTGAVSVVRPEDFQDAQNLTVGQAIQGRAAGIQVRTDGVIGSEPNIKIRGIGNLGNTNPIYVIDGLIVTSGLRDLNVNDIESIQILKDASAAAIFGNRAANGVVIITTKKGESGPMKVAFESKFGFQKQPDLNLAGREEFIRLNDMSFTNAGLAPQNHFEANTDWEEAVFQTAQVHDHNLTFSGGSETGSYLVSGNYLTNSGTAYGTALERIGIRINSEGQRGSFKLGENLSITSFDITPHALGNGILRETLRFSADMPVYNSSNPGGFSYGEEGRARTFGLNPIGIQELSRSDNKNLRIRGNIYGEVSLFDVLTFRSSVGVESNFHGSKTLRKEGNWRLNEPFVQSNLRESKGQYFSLLFDNTLTFSKAFGAGNVTAILGSSYQSENSEEIWGWNYGLFSSGAGYLDVLDAGSTNPSAGGTRYEINRIGYFGRINYEYGDKYLLQGTLRRDASSQFGPENRVGYFPSLAAGWRLSNEAFFDVSWISDLKLRASYGELGNSASAGPYDYIPILTTFPRYAFGTPETIADGAIQWQLVNEDLTWETKKQTNIGFDLGVLEDRLRFSAEYYISKTEDVLINFPILMATGNAGGDPLVNAGILENRGFEIETSWSGNAGDFHYNVSANITTVRNRVGALPYGDNSVVSGVARSVVGKPLARFYLLKTDGIFRGEDEILAHTNSQGQVIQPNARPGDIRYVDHNDDGMISVATDRQFIGNPWPQLEAGLMFSASYKNFDLNVQGMGSFGHEVYSGFRQLVENFTFHHNFVSGSVDPWTPENPDSDFPRIIYNDNRNTYLESDRWLEKGDFFRINQLTLGYTFNLTPLKQYVDNIRFSVTAQNLHTFTNYNGWDPAYVNSNVLQFGVDNSYPSPKSVTFALSAKF